MLLSRRHLLAAGAASIAAAWLGRAPSLGGEELAAPAAGTAAALRFSSWLNFVQGDLTEQLRWVESQGFEAIELRGNYVKMQGEWKEALRHTTLVPSALDWSHLGPIIGGSPAERQAGLDSLKRCIDIAGDLRAPNIIIVPPRRGQFEPMPEEARVIELVAEALASVADQAVHAGTCLMIEPVSSKGVHGIHSIADGVAMCQLAKKPGIGIVGDFCHMIQVETDITQGLVTGGPLVRQIHLSSRRRTLPGQEAEDAAKFTAGFRGLKRIGYHGFCSFECGNKETYQAQVPASMAFLRTCWAEA